MGRRSSKSSGGVIAGFSLSMALLILIQACTYDSVNAAGGCCSTSDEMPTPEQSASTQADWVCFMCSMSGSTGFGRENMKQTSNNINVIFFFLFSYFIAKLVENIAGKRLNFASICDLAHI